jgi:hypothetical protein
MCEREQRRNVNILRTERRAESPSQAQTNPATAPNAQAGKADGRSTETPTNAEAAADPEAKSNAVSVKPS